MGTNGVPGQHLKPRKRNMYRLPWSMNDNPIGWLEITDRCNIYCKGCYRQQLVGHFPIEQIKDDILFLKEYRNCDNISIAGGEPLVHPQILEIVSFIREHGMKPLILTNGVRLNNNIGLARELKAAGALASPSTSTARSAGPAGSARARSSCANCASSTPRWSLRSAACS
ncbi:MAG: radical SAM protein [Anaerolineae bacterium]|nr:radical SAM protein [Anaerolineae bacterium]